MIVEAGSLAKSQVASQTTPGYFVRILHLGIGESLYWNLSALKENIAPGMRVDQLGTIGYAGSSGPEKPYFHYELRVNGLLVDPLGVDLPPEKTLRGRALFLFQQELKPLDALRSTDSKTYDLFDAQ